MVSPGGRRTTVNQAALRSLTGPAGPLGRMLQQRLELVTQAAKVECPVSPVGENPNGSGELRSSIGWSLDVDGRGLYGDVSASAPHALPVLLGTRPHVIEAKGDYPLRNRKGVVFGRRVQHPGTRPNPFLQRALNRAR